MKVAVSSTGKDLGSQVDPRFGRCAFFVIVETDDMAFEVFENENGSLSGGAGVQAASFVSSKGADVVLTGRCGPNALKVFAAAGVKVYDGQSGTVEETVLRYKEGGLREASRPAGEEPAETLGPASGANFQSRGQGRCMGGPGRGMGMGGGRGRCMGGSGGGMGGGGGRRGAFPGPGVSGDREDLAELKKQAADLRERLEEIQAKIERMQ